MCPKEKPLVPYATFLFYEKKEEFCHWLTLPKLLVAQERGQGHSIIKPHHPKVIGTYSRTFLYRNSVL